jgi:nicotinamidase-related amidase
MKRILLVVDCQPAFADKNKVNYNKIIKFIKEHKNEYDYIYATRTISGNLNTKRYLSRIFNKEKRDLDFHADVIILKSECGLNDYNLLNANCEYDIVGCETDNSVLKIAMDLFDMGFSFRILKDYVYTDSDFHKAAINVINKNLSRFN